MVNDVENLPLSLFTIYTSSSLKYLFMTFAQFLICFFFPAEFEDSLYSLVMYEFFFR